MTSDTHDQFRAHIRAVLIGFLIAKIICAIFPEFIRRVNQRLCARRQDAARNLAVSTLCRDTSKGKDTSQDMALSSSVPTRNASDSPAVTIDTDVVHEDYGDYFPITNVSLLAQEIQEIQQHRWRTYKQKLDQARQERDVMIELRRRLTRTTQEVMREILSSLPSLDRDYITRTLNSYFDDISHYSNPQDCRQLTSRHERSTPRRNIVKCICQYHNWYQQNNDDDDGYSPILCEMLGLRTISEYGRLGISLTDHHIGLCPELHSSKAYDMVPLDYSYFDEYSVRGSLSR